MIEKFTIGFFSVVILYAGFYLWEWLVKKFKMNGIIAVIITIVVISLLVGSISCIFDPNCKSLY